MQNIKKYTIIAIGSFVFALSVNWFTLPSKIVTGGFSGIATILYHLFQFPTAFTVGILNIIILIFALKSLGKAFVIDSLAGIILIPVFLQLTASLPPLTRDPLLASIYGGVLLGIGVGMTFSQGSTTGGTDIMSRISQKKYPHLSVGLLLTVIDLVIIGASVLAFGNIELSLYGILSLVISAAVIDAMISRLNCAKLIFIITDCDNDMESKIMATVQRGVTAVAATGGFSGKNKKILLCVTKPKQTEPLKTVIRTVDPNAFIIVNESKEILGNGFQYYR